MRTLDIHKTNPANGQLEIKVMDQPGAGGANHHYEITGFDTASNPSLDGMEYHGLEVLFQNGPIAEVGVNGVTHEAFLAILIDRLESFQQGKYACTENGLALSHLRAALTTLQARTIARAARGVEGTSAI